MDIADLTKTLQAFVSKSERELEEILRGPVRGYLEATLASPDWFAAVMHTVGSEADEAVRLSQTLEGMELDQLAADVTKRLAGGIISTTLVPSVLPTPLLTSTAQATLSCLRERSEVSRQERKSAKNRSPQPDPLDS